MKRRPVLASFKAAAASLIVLTVFVSLEAETSPNSNANLSPEERELLKARRANEDAQTEYYREQIKNLRHPAPTVGPTPKKSFWQNVADNPAGVIGVAGTILGALIVAIVGLTTLYVNNRNAVKVQRDTQFYEALKRLGEKDSPTIRAGAGGLLGLMAQVEWHELSFSKDWLSVSVVRSKPYFTTALGQLLIAIMVEENLIAIEAIRDGLRQLIPLAPTSIAHRIHETNLKLQEEFSVALAEFFMLLKPEEVNDQEIRSAQMKRLTGYDERDLEDFVLKLSESKETIHGSSKRLKTTNEDRGTVLAANEQRLRITSSRLRANVALFCLALERFRPRHEMDRSFENAFLVGGVITMGADLSGLDLSGAFLPKILSGVNLSKTTLMGTSLGNLYACNLTGSFLMGARLRLFSQVDVTDARLANIKPDPVSLLFFDANWWKADFFNTNPNVREVDPTLLEPLLEKHRDKMPPDPEAWHPSVRMYLESKKEDPTPDAGTPPPDAR